MRGRLAIAATAAAALGAAAAPHSAFGTCAGVRGDGPSPFGSTPCPGVRPGAPVRIVTEFGEPPTPQCTLGFLLRSGGERYLTTAGHCVELESERVYAPGEEPVASDAEGNRIGEVVYSVHEPVPAATERDIALIRLDRTVDADPEVCHFGGPAGLNEERVLDPQPLPVHYYGNTFAGGYVPVAGEWVLPARTGISNGLPHRRRVHFSGHASFFDSGAPVLSGDGRALALISGPLGADGGYAGVVAAPRLPYLIELAEEALAIELRLVTAG